MFKCICDYITKTKLERKTQDWKVCFYKNTWLHYHTSGASNTVETFSRIKYSGMYVTLEDKRKYYECLIDDKIAWVNVSELRFAVPGGEDE